MDHAGTSQLVKDIRELWSHAGVEVESISGNKVRCRMPPYFQGVQEFTQSLEHYDAVVDLETSMSAGTASVVFLVFAGDNADVTQHPHIQQRKNSTSKEWVMVTMVLMCMVLQIVSMINFEKLAKFLKTIFTDK